MRDRTFRTVYPLWVILNVSIVVLIVALVFVAWWIARDVNSGVDINLFLIFAAFVGYFVVRGLLLAHTVTIHQDDTISFRRLMSTVVLQPHEISAIKASWFRNFLAIHSSRGLILVPQWEWNGLHSLVGHLRRRNPAVELTDVPQKP